MKRILPVAPLCAGSVAQLSNRELFKGVEDARFKDQIELSVAVCEGVNFQSPQVGGELMFLASE